MYDVISLVLVAVVVAVGAVGLFGGHGTAVAGEGRPLPPPAARRPVPPAYRIVGSSGSGPRPASGSGPRPASAPPDRPAVPIVPVSVPAGATGVHDGATRIFPAVPGADEPGADEPEGPDPDAEVVARSGLPRRPPTGGPRP